MALKRIDHVSVLAHDAGAAVAFYRDLLGFELKAERRMPERGMNIYELKAGGDFVEVIEPLGAQKPSSGLKHVAFASDDIDADFAELKRKGAKLVHSEVQRMGRVSLFFLQAPAGELIEVIQYHE